MNVNDIQKLLAQVAKKQNQFKKNEKPASIKPGVNKIVLMPGWNPTSPEIFWREFGAHYIKDPGSGKVAAYYPCDNVIFGRDDCPVCMALAQASRMTNDPATLELIKQGRAGTQFLVNAIVIGENNNQPVVMALSKTAFEQLMNIIMSWASAVFDSSNPQVISIDRTGTGFDTRYMVTVTPEKFALPAGTLNNLKNLDEYVNQRSEQLAKKATAAISGIAGAPITMLAYQDFSNSAQAPAAQPQPIQATPAPAPAPAQTISQADIPSTGATTQTPPPVTLDSEMDELLEGLDGL